ncbi:MAG: hypothetical protein LBJ69_00495 [Holosporales bacterium]|jgi:hypothetical protein|nr:hypothetical protein [Holosporales bacterium]
MKRKNFGRCKKRGIGEKIMDALVKKDRVRLGKEELPTYEIIDSQSVKTTDASEERGI